MTKQLLIVANTPSPNTQELAEAVVRGASHPDIDNVEVIFKQPLQAGPEDVLAADAVLIGSTENFGYMAGLIKDFFERIYYPCLEQTEGRSCALYIRAGNDGRGTRASIEKILTGLRWRPIQPTLILRGDFDPGFIDQCEELGMTMAAGLEAGIY
ncbi:flavodoxin family protein [Motiliproteus coralliicola]|uniref:Flavodoxin family protein n=1 Tax=Motiliproteus coralliicola TaxID=2283196 RepID=A0A369WCJ4_9GAMM|nr:flavodoxin family protein [Motiliproteus coralliicola]RDE18899.1 flavodoxin family protein [Motiliproteus coralliicola]